MAAIAELDKIISSCKVHPERFTGEFMNVFHRLMDLRDALYIKLKEE
jgi:hypothetical protein